MKRFSIIILGSTIVIVSIILIVMISFLFQARQNQDLKNCLLKLKSPDQCNSCPSASPKTKGLYKNYTSGWKKYADKKISFEYPQTWLIDGDGQGNIKIGEGTSQDMAWLVQIGTVLKNAISMDDQIQDIKKDTDYYDRSILEENISLGDAQAIRLDVVPSCFTPNQGRGIYLFVDKKDYYINVVAQETGDPLYDFPIEYLLSTIQIY